MLRVDPLTDSKAFDLEFFEGEEYSKYKKVVELYLKNEGFEHMDSKQEVVIQILDRWWSVRNVNS